MIFFLLANSVLMICLFIDQLVADFFIDQLGADDFLLANLLLKICLFIDQLVADFFIDQLNADDDQFKRMRFTPDNNIYAGHIRRLDYFSSVIF